MTTSHTANCRGINVVSVKTNIFILDNSVARYVFVLASKNTRALNIY